MISVLRQVYAATICRIIIRAIIPSSALTHKNTPSTVKCPIVDHDWQLVILDFCVFSLSQSKFPCMLYGWCETQKQ